MKLDTPLTIKYHSRREVKEVNTSWKKWYNEGEHDEYEVTSTISMYGEPREMVAVTTEWEPPKWSPTLRERPPLRVGLRASRRAQVRRRNLSCRQSPSDCKYARGIFSEIGHVDKPSYERRCESRTRRNNDPPGPDHQKKDLEHRPRWVG